MKYILEVIVFNFQNSRCDTVAHTSPKEFHRPQMGSGRPRSPPLYLSPRLCGSSCFLKSLVRKSASLSRTRYLQLTHTSTVANPNLSLGSRFTADVRGSEGDEMSAICEHFHTSQQLCMPNTEKILRLLLSFEASVQDSKESDIPEGKTDI